MIADSKQQSPIDCIIEQEYHSNLSSDIEQLFNSSTLSSKQKEQIEMYYFQDKTLSEIGKEFGVSREAVRQNIKRGLDIIKNFDICRV
jgi:hypothetical protein